jgi:hypothetical protein
MVEQETIDSQSSYNERLMKEIEVRRRTKLLTDEKLEKLLELLRSDDGKLINEGTVREEHRESNHVD